MKLKELICQGVGPNSELIKFEFGESYNFIEIDKKGLEAQEFNRVVTALLFPSYSPWEVNTSFGDPEQSTLKLGVTFTHNSNSYRFVRDIAKKNYAFSKFNPAKSNFEEISRDLAFIKKAFKETFKIPQENVFKALFKIDPGYLSKKLSGEESLGLNDSKAYFENLEHDSSVEEKYERMKGLVVEHQTVEKMKEIEFEIDELQSKLFEITDKIQKVKDKEEEIKTVIQELDEYKAIDSINEVPQDIEKKLSEYENLGEKKDKELVGLDNKVEDLVDKLAKLDLNPIQKDPVFLGSAALVLIAFVLTVALAHLRLFFFPVIVLAMGSVAWRLINFFKRREKEEALKKEIRASKDEKGVIQKKFDIETSVVRKFLHKTGESDAKDALDSMKRARSIRKRFEGEKAALEALKFEVKFDEIKKLKIDIEEKIKKLEAKLRNLPSVSMDPNDMLNEIERLKLEIGDENLEILAKEDKGVRVPQNVYERLIVWSSKFLKFPIDKIIAALKNSYEVNLKLLSAKSFTDVKWGETGPVEFVLSSSETRGLTDLTEEQNFMAFFAFQFTMLQLVSKYCPLPVVVFGTSEVAFPRYDKKLFLQAVSHLSKTFQIVHVT